MRRFIDMTRASVALTLLAAAFGAAAGDCRAALRPLLLDATPDANSLSATRALCRREAEAGSADARYQLALFHLGLAGEWQPEMAIPLIRDAAAQGVSEAQYWLAWQYEAGPLLPRDEAIALGWYQRAANADHRLAIGRLAQAYDHGELGLPRDPLLATQYRARQSQCERNRAGSDR
jgi:TPR repeat protein